MAVSENLKITDMRFLHFFLGFEIMHTKDGIFFSQRKYTRDINKFLMVDCRPISTPFSPGDQDTRPSNEVVSSLGSRAISWSNKR